MILTGLIILFGIVMRLVFFLQNRNLFIDEANVARNIYERSFIGLLYPLNYEQYAGPLFLWIIKVFTLIGGYSEYAFRAFSLVCGILSLFVLLNIFKMISNVRSYWYPLFIFANAFIFLHYSAELKQYMSDVLTTLMLIWLAMKVGVVSKSNAKFVLLWSIVGSAAIWLSMPSVFTLAGVGIYYLYNCLQQKNYKKMIPVIITGTIWIAQFVFYYLAILKPQANTEYLQNFHKDYFLFLIPKNGAEVLHDYRVYRELIIELGKGDWLRRLNSVLLILGIILFFMKDSAKALLFLVPIVGAVIAAGFNQYSLLQRVALFMLPLFLVFIGYGLDVILSKKITVLNVLVLLATAGLACKENSLYLIRDPWKFETITESLQFLKDHNIDGKETYIHLGARPAFLYYTQIHPAHEQWDRYRTAHLPRWNTSYNGICSGVKGRVAFIFTSIDPQTLNDYKEIFDKRLKKVATKEVFYRRCFAYIYEHK